MNALATTTNAVKGGLTLGVLLVIEGIEVFHLYTFEQDQKDWITRAVAAAGLLWIWATHKLSKKRLPD